ncbi:DNA-directed RNA polymerase II subunit RPB11 [Malassezia restricta]|jgi:RNA polymerase rpb3/rpb11 dimerisation domain|uniref:DNA-directed RNA polymerase II subunit RPB11 n=1 Tax=Malassezia restricta (strain ATCC 96810 / NBRC 103918 / CBS 7877) TaxID=425264 RepID=A0A3G2S8H6_MALR7|nr:DNA-directed RNA polymerase II subunit RPB11 [Malassezia restricta]AXA50954.1 DNA-directed RNA polymerase II subunit RPB11 [Malassezia restricta]AYO43498.1 DNA-directed RNA polymerase II subunit RPB11 [Malassezia restricta CBS 7877]
MANAPDRYTLFLLQPGEQRIEVQEDMRIPNAATFVFNKEDHTLGNMLRHAVLSMPGVLFCGYKVPHPLEPRVLVKIQTDGSQTPVEVLQQACTKLIVHIGSLKQNWAKEVRLGTDSGSYGTQLWPSYEPGAPMAGSDYDADRAAGGALGGYVDM